MNELEAKQTAAQDAEDWGSPGHVRVLGLMAVTIIGIYLCYRLAIPFLPSLTGALTLAVLFAPFHRWLEPKIRHRNLAALLSCFVAALIVVVPVTFVVERLLEEVVNGVGVLNAKVQSGEWRRILEADPCFSMIGRWIEQQINLPETMKTVSSWLTDTTASLIRSSGMQLVDTILTFYFLFYFLRDRGVALHALRSISPLADTDMNRLFVRVGDTIHATIYGTLVVAMVQGTLGGLMFWWLGLPTPLIWGMVMGLLAIIPILGAFIIWIPAAIFLALDGNIGAALLLTGWGMIVVGGIDNLIYPILVGDRLKMHTILVFISLVGGVILFGPSGLILGPMALTATFLLLEIWRHRNLRAP